MFVCRCCDSCHACKSKRTPWYLRSGVGHTGGCTETRDVLGEENPLVAEGQEDAGPPRVSCLCNLHLIQRQCLPSSSATRKWRMLSRFPKSRGPRTKNMPWVVSMASGPYHKVRTLKEVPCRGRALLPWESGIKRPAQTQGKNKPRVHPVLSSGRQPTKT